MPELSVASFNAHAGMDGWGRSYDLVDACRQLNADVIVLQETFAPLNGTSQADEVAAKLDYHSVEFPLARAWRRPDALSEGKGWQPRKVGPRAPKALRVGARVDLTELAGYEEGTWGLAVLCRPAVVTTEAVLLGRLKRDFTQRGALFVELDVATEGAEVGRFTVIGTHAAHISAGSPFQIRRLYRQLPSDGSPAALAGDMNLWGPPVSLLLPGWRRAVRGRTWPSWRPHSQPDHVLVTSVVRVIDGAVVRTGNSDHLAVRAHLAW